MASPQLENGYTRIANEIIEALIKMEISGQELQLILLILRKTYGFQKKKDYMSYSQIAQEMNISRRHTIRIVNKLRNAKILIGSDKEVTTSDTQVTNLNNCLEFNKDYCKWGVVTRLSPSDMQGTQLVTRRVRYLKTKEIIQKKHIRKKNRSEERVPHEVAQIVLYYKQIEGEKEDDKGWDKLYFKRYAKSAKQLLDFFGNIDKVKICIREVIDALKEKGLSYTLETVVKKASKWRKYHEQVNS